MNRALLEHAEAKVEKRMKALKTTRPLTPRETDALRAKLHSVAENKVKEFWVYRLPHQVGSAALASGVAIGIAIGVGVASPAALAAIGIASGVAIATSVVVLYRKIGSALDGTAYAFLIGIGAAPERKGLLARDAKRAATKTIESYTAHFELTAPQRAKLAGAVHEARHTKLVEFYDARAKVELAAIATTAVGSAGIAVAAGLTGPIALGAAGAFGTGMMAFNAFLLHQKMRGALEGAAQAAIQSLVERGELESLPRVPLRQWSRQRLRVVVEQATRRYGLSDDEKEELSRRLDLMRENKLRDFWQRRPASVLPTPLAHAGMIAAAGMATGSIDPLDAAIRFAIFGPIHVGRAVFMTWVRMNGALEGQAENIVTDMLDRRTPPSIELPAPAPVMRRTRSV
jgi:hypothetical protein